MKRVKFCGGILGGSYCWVTEQLTEDENGMLLLTLPETVYCGRCCGTNTKQDGKDIIYHKQERKGETKYIWVDEVERLNL